MRILAIETSCDETSVAVLTPKDLTVVTASQIDVHRITGGVVPEVAAREHVQVMIPLLKEALARAAVTPQQLDRIAVTTGPGLMTSLMVGVETARTLAYGWQKPLFPINHIEGHIAANWLPPLDTSPVYEPTAFATMRAFSGPAPAMQFPAVALVVSGGHTELLCVSQPGHYELIGATRDDAAGECFDKCARILDLPYPGGPSISAQAEQARKAWQTRRAEQGQPTKQVQPVKFPSPMLTSHNFDFSFSGLKTAVLYFRRDHPTAPLAEICAALEDAIIHVLVDKTKRAIKQYQAKSLLVGGGVAANLRLREQLRDLDVPVYIPPLELCTDNAAMIAAAAQFHDQPADLFAFQADPNWELTPR